MKNSLTNKMIVFLLMATIIPIVTSSVITYQLTTRAAKQNAISENQKLLYYGASNLVQYMEVIDKLSLSIYNDVSLGGTLYKIIEDGLDDYESKMTIYNTLLRISNFLPDIYQARLDILKNRKSYLLVDKSLILESTKLEPMNRKPAHAYGQVFPTHDSDLSGMEANTIYTSKKVVTFYRPIYEIPKQHIIGHLAIDFTLGTIERTAKQLYKKDEQLYILDPSGKVVYASDPGQIGLRWNPPWLSRVKADQGTSGSFAWTDDKFQGIYIYSKLSNKFMDWIIVKGIPYHILYKDARSVAVTNSLVYAVLLIFLIIATVWISIYFTKPIKQLTRTITKIEQGNVHAELTTTRTDEIGVLIRRFQQMMSTINNLILREYRLELANKTNQLKALQAQINPHFLNNALQSIGTLALQRKELKIYSLISSLGQMMSYHMLSSEIIVPFSDEVRYVQSYLELQKQRFEDKLTVHQEYDERAWAVSVPKMILQPVVENYFKHGFSAKDSCGQLWISARMTAENHLKVVVEDNGRGMEESERLMLQTRLNTLENHWIHEMSDKRVGLTNVLSRLRLYCGPDSSIEIAPRPGGGLRVTLIIPVHQGGNYYETADR